jgi:lysophospholipase L1-like esterase
MPKKKKIIFIGDSITNMLSVESIFNAVNFGISGDTVQRMKKIIGTYSNLERKIIVLALGINDIPRDTEELFNDYKELVSNIPKSSKILVSSILPIDESIFYKHWKVRKTNKQINNVNKKLKEFAGKTENVFYFDTGKLLRNKDRELISNFHKGDGIHLNNKGYKQWVIGLKNAIEFIDNN